MRKENKWHIRAPETKLVPIEKLKADPKFKVDKRAVDLIAQQMTGKIAVALTRIDTSSIYSGFYERTKDGNISHITNYSDEGVSLFESEIRGGRRFSLLLYWNNHAPNSGGYVCPDDEKVLRAYQNLGINLVPCQILRPIERAASESALWVQNKAKQAGLVKSIPAQREHWPSFLGRRDIEPQAAIERLIELCSDTIKDIDRFHIEGKENVHYHNLIRAVVKRHIESIESINILAKLNRFEHAKSILRMAYEAFLNFYIDWIAPEFMGPRLQLLSHIRSAESSGSDQYTSYLKFLENFTELMENTSRKARLSPLGILFHDKIYPALSLVAHQSYKNIEENLSKESSSGAGGNKIYKNIIMYLDIITAALIHRIRNDVGIQTHSIGDDEH